MNNEDRFHHLIALYHSDGISDSEFTELEAILRDSSEARETYHCLCRVDGSLRTEAEGPTLEKALPKGKIIAPFFRPLAWFAAAATVILSALLFQSHRDRPKIIADLISAENASWESSLPTEPGSKLSRGYLKLTSGIATIRFRSGAEIMLEAPAKLMVKGPMRAKLVSGSAVLNVPKPAIGFVLETPEGRVVDHGTSFAVTVVGKGRVSNFSVIEGEIAVHLPNSDKETRLTEKQSATIVDEVMETFDGPLPLKSPTRTDNTFRIGTHGRTASVIQNNRSKWLIPDLLLVKRTNKRGNHDRYAFFEFDLAEVDIENVAEARLRLNQVPSGIGYAVRLPKLSRFSVYGLTNQAKMNWQPDVTWADSPSPSDGISLGQFNIPRSRQDGSYGIATTQLLNFLKANSNQKVTLIVDRVTTQIEGEVPGLVHAFAADTHPEVSGPMLEFILKD